MNASARIETEAEVGHGDHFSHDATSIKDIKGVQGASGCAKSKVVKRKFEDKVDTKRAPDADTDDAAAATPATPATPQDAGAAAASGRGRSSSILRGGASTAPPGARSRKQRRTGGGGTGITVKSTGCFSIIVYTMSVSRCTLALSKHCTYMVQTCLYTFMPGQVVRIPDDIGIPDIGKS
jgi:hypothetical protein